MADTETPKNPAPAARRRRGKGVPADELHRRYPSLRSLAQPDGVQGAWVATFNARPNVMAALLADLIKQVHAQPGQVGQRPMPREEEVDFHALIYGEENDLPLVEVLPKLMSFGERTLAERAHMSRTQVQRMLAGEYHPDVRELRLIAKAVRKPAVFFVEYRQAMVTSAFIAMLEQHPGLATKRYRTYLNVRMGE